MTHYDLGQAPSLAFSSHVKRPHNQTRRSRLKQEKGAPTGAWPQANPAEQTEGYFLQQPLRSGPQLLAPHAHGPQVNPRAQTSPSLTHRAAPGQASSVGEARVWRQSLLYVAPTPRAGSHTHGP